MTAPPSSRSIAASRTLLHLFSEQVRRRGGAVALRSKRAGAWSTTTWSAWDEEARAFAAGLAARGVAKGDRVALLLPTHREAVIADLGVLLAGATPVPIYPTLTHDQIAFIVRDAGARAIVVDDAGALERLQLDVPVRIALGTFAKGGLPNEGYDALLTTGRAALQDDPELVSRRERAITSSDVASIFYTSGTTGDPKGVVLTHDSFVFEVDAVGELLGITAADEQLLFLPLAHIFGKMLVVAAMAAGAVTSFATSMLTALDDAEEVRPTYFGSVPRLFEKVHHVALSKAAEAGKVQEKIFDWALDIGHRVAALQRGGESVPLALELQHRYADKLVLQKVRKRFGGRVRLAISGAAPIDASLCEWFHAIGIPIYEGYGLTETTAATNINRPQAFRFGTVGRPIPGVEVRIGEDGEVLVRGPNVMRGYHERDGETAEAIDAQGWLHTGDVGAIDDEGYLTITDRKKDLLVTAGGKNVAPQRVEAMLARSPLIARAAVVGDRRPYLVALIVIDEAAIRLELPALNAATPAELAEDPRVIARVQRAIDDANAGLASFESVKRFAILDRELSVDRGELTPTLKLRRRAIETSYRARIDALYPA